MAFRKLEPLSDKIGRERIRDVVDAFYRRAAADVRIGHHFAGVDFPRHVERISDFWYQSLGGRLESPPTIDMFARHRPLNLTRADLACWFEHFDATTGEMLPEPLAAEWQRLARGIGSRLADEVIDDA